MQAFKEAFGPAASLMRPNIDTDVIIRIERLTGVPRDQMGPYAFETLRYQGGLSPYLNVLTAENGALTARRNVADLQAQAISLDVALVRALGGGFSAADLGPRLAAR